MKGTRHAISHFDGDLDSDPRPRGTTPYDDIDPIQRWSTVSQDVARGVIDAQGRARFTIGGHERVASAGSCFAARLAEHMRAESSQYLVTERAPRWLDEAQEIAFGYRPFSARYGLVYTAQQLLQLFERAYGTFEPIESAWEWNDRFVDPFRPRTSPNGYGSAGEVVEDRKHHLAAVREMFEGADVFFFTVGLTEMWRDRRDGAVYPYCPGLAGGTFDPVLHEFHNANVAENVRILQRFIESARAVNPGLRLIFSVSPVPIGATFERAHVARSSTWSKSVLRVALEELYRTYDFVDYFAAYEMVSQSFFGTDPFTEDRRHLKPGVAESVVATFRSYYFADASDRARAPGESTVVREQIVCDEDILAR